MSSRFMFEDDDEERDLLGGTDEQQALIHMTANEVAILSGCSSCGARLVHNGRKVRGAKMIYPPGGNKRTATGTPLCGECWRRLMT
jgi:hypothetical protein